MALDIGTLAGYLDLDTGPFDSALDGAQGKMGKLSAGALVVGGVAGAALAKGITDSINIDAANDKLAAQLGLSTKEAETYGKAAGDLYANAYGGSIEEVNDALGAVSSSLGEFLDGSEAALEGATAKAMDLATAFGIDVADSASLAGYVVKNGLARDTDEAFDLITRSMQEMPAQMRGELIPIVEEYGVHLKAMGFEGEDAFNLLVQASQNGTFELDKTGDALKELMIRATDMSATSVTAYESMGMSADDMASRFVAGGDSARGALSDLVDGLLAIEDPTERANTAIALFGTPLEDLSVTQIPDFLRSLKGGQDVLGETEGAADALGKALADNLGSKVDSITRKAQLLVVDFLESPFGPWVTGAGALVLGIVAAVGPMQTLVGNARTVGSTLRTGASSLTQFEGGLRGLANAAGIAAGIAGIATAIYQVSEAEKAADISRLTEQFMATNDAMAVLEESTDSWRGGADKLLGTFEKLLDQSTVAAERFVDQIEAQAGATDATRAMRDAIEQRADAERQASTDAEASTAATRDQTAATEDGTVATAEATAALQEHADQLQAMYDPIFGMINAQRSHEEALAMVEEAEADLAVARRDHGASSDEATAAEGRLRDAQIAVGDSMVSLQSAAYSLQGAIDDGSVSVSDARARLYEMAAEMGVSKENADVLAFALGGAAGQADVLSSKHARPQATLTDSASGPIDHVARKVTELDGRYATVTVELRTTGLLGAINQSLGLIPKFHTGGLVPGGAGDEVLAILQGGERVLNRGAAAMLEAGTGALGAPGPGGGAGGAPAVNIYGLQLTTTEPARSWLDEASWRLAG